MKDFHLYNIRIIKSYIEFIENYYPDVDITSILDNAGITEYELEDMGYWFTQEQADRFFEIVIQKTGNSNIAREAGRFGMISKSFGTFREYLIGFITPIAAFAATTHVAAKVTKGCTMKAQKVQHNKVEVISEPAQGVEEKPYQCENRMGILEAVPSVFTNRFPIIEHSECLHKGDKHCKYIISWDEPPSVKWKRKRNFVTLFCVLVCIPIFLYFSLALLPCIILSCTAIVLSVSLYTEFLKNKELARNIEIQSDSAEQLWQEIDKRYNDALLVQEIGQAISTILDIDELLDFVMQALEKRSDFDRGLVMMPNCDKTRLVFITGYGYDPDKEGFLKSTEFHLDNTESKGAFVDAFKNQVSHLVNDINDISKDLSNKSKKFAELMGVNNFICVPIFFKEESMGVLAVDNIHTKRPLTKSDMNRLSGIAQQIGISINNARFFRQLQSSEEKYRELVENANSIIMRIDTSGRITFFNEFAQKFFQYKENELLGRNVVGTIIPDDDPYVGKLKSMFREIDKIPDKYISTQSKNTIKNKEIVWIAWTNKPILDTEDNLKEILCIGNDITDIRRVEEERKNLEEQLFQSAKLSAVGQLASGIAHEFNNFLSVILGHAQLSLREASITEIKESLQEIEKVTKRGSNLVTKLSAFARPKEPEFEIQDITEVIDDVIKFQKKQVKLENIDIKVEFQDNSEVSLDRGQLQQVFLNLFINAIHAIHPKGKGKILISVKNVENFLEIRFSDTGIGMSKETMQKIFDPFFSTKGAWAKDNLGISGTGLGLSVSHAIIKQHNGTIAVESKKGKGTTFIIRLPIPEVKVVKEEKIKIKENGVDIEKTKDLKILVVDDEEEVISLMKLIFKRTGFNNYITENDSEHVVQVFNNFNPDIVFLDLLMPNIDGEQIFEEFQSINKEVPVVFMSGKLDLEENEYIKKGAYDFIKKPFNVNDIFDILNKVANEKTIEYMD